MKILCLLDGIVKPGDRWLWNYLPISNDALEFLVTTGVADRFEKWGKLFGYYPAFWRSGFRALLKTRKTSYDLVVAWEGKNGHGSRGPLNGPKTPLQFVSPAGLGAKATTPAFTRLS